MAHFKRFFPADPIEVGSKTRKAKAEDSRMRHRRSDASPEIKRTKAARAKQETKTKPLESPSHS